MIRKPTIHRMNRRSEYKNYMLPGIYHITVKAAEALRAPFGKVVGNIDKKDGDPDEPRVTLSPVGKMVEQELLHSPSVAPATIGGKMNEQWRSADFPLSKKITTKAR